MFKTHGVALHPGTGHSRGFSVTTNGHMLPIFFRTILIVHMPVLRPQNLQGFAPPRILGSTSTSPLCKCTATLLRILAKAMSTPQKQTEFCSFCHTSIGLYTQLGVVWHLCRFHKGRQCAYWNDPTTIAIHLGIQKHHMATPKFTFRTKASRPLQHGRIIGGCNKGQILTHHGDGMSCRKGLLSGTIHPCTINRAP